jgi:endoribonuclease Dicer
VQVSIQLLAEFPLWHEGYLSRKKDHTVSNYKLAKEAITRNLYNWIIRDVFIPRKWSPELLHHENNEDDESDNTSNEDLSTKILADVVEAIIGACYLYGGYDLSIECGRMFDLGIKWESISNRVVEMLSRVEIPSEPPEGLSYVEEMLGYQFEHKLLAVEALTHASHQHSPYQTTSYERLEFLGDAVLDIIVTECLYRAPGKSYSPGHMHLRKSAVVNTHYLAFLCLSTSISLTTSMPTATGQGKSRNISFIEENQCIYLWQCLQHSSGRVIEDQTATFVAFKKHHDEIAEALTNGDIFPWSLLTRLQAPKFFSDMIESLIGAVYLDTQGDFDTVCRVITKLGILPMLERIVREDVDVLHPISRVSMWASKKGKKIEYEFEKKDGNVECILKFEEGEEIFRASTAWRGKVSQDEARFAAAEGAIRMLRLREEAEA